VIVLDVRDVSGYARFRSEDGAYAVAMAVADQLGFQVVARLHHQSGADWVVAPKGDRGTITTSSKSRG
jgi:hypothetical protein